MIVEAVINLLSYFVVGIINLFPTFPKLDNSGLNGVIRVLSMIDMFVSLKVVSASFVIIFVFMNLQVVWSVIMWVVRKLPGVE